MTTEKKKRKECEAEGCTIVPVFNYNNESSGRFCKAHRQGVILLALFVYKQTATRWLPSLIAWSCAVTVTAF